MYEILHNIHDTATILTYKYYNDTDTFHKR